MKVYVKKDKALKLLGEGKIYSKKDLVLREFNAGGNSVVAAVPGATNVRQFVNQGAKTYHQNGNVGLIQGEMGQFDNQNDSSTGEGLGIDLPVNATGQQIAKVQNMANQQGNDDKKEDNKKDQQKPEENKDKKDEQKPQEQQKPQMSKENAEQLLNAAIQNEKQTQDKLKKAQQQPQRRKIEKNW